MIEDLGRIPKVVVRGQHEFVGRSKPVQRTGKGLLGISVESGEWLVEQVNIGLLGPSASEESALLLSPGERLNLPISKGGEIGHFEGLCDKIVIGLSKLLPESQRRETTHLSQPANRHWKIPVHTLMLRNIGNRLARSPDLVALKSNTSCLPGKESGDSFDERGLPGTIRPEQPDAGTAPKRKVQVVNRRHPVVSHREIFDDKLVAHGTGMVTTSSISP